MKPASLPTPIFERGAHDRPPVVRAPYALMEVELSRTDSIDTSVVEIHPAEIRDQGERLRARVREGAGDADVGRQGWGCREGRGRVCKRQIPRPLTRQGRRLHKQP